jgi:hypothetical protein
LSRGFFNFFEKFFEPFGYLSLIWYLYYTTVASRCQEVFETFSNFFLRESTLPCSLLNPCPLDTIIIPHHRPNVKGFWEKNKKIFFAKNS